MNENEAEFRDLLPLARMNGASAWVKRLMAFSGRSVAVQDPPRKPHSPRYLPHGPEIEVYVEGDIEDPGELLQLAESYLGIA